MAKDPGERPALGELLTALVDPLEEHTEPWPEQLAASIKVRADQAQDLSGVRRATHEHRPLIRHARALLDAGLNDRIVVEAVTFGKR